MLPKLVLIAICFAPVALLLAGIFLQRRKHRKTAKSPFTDLLLRPAGESLRLKIYKLDEKLNDSLMMAIGFPLMYGLILFYVVPANTTTLSLLIGIGPIVILCVGATYAIWGRGAIKLRREIRDYELGFQGERYVGEQLNQLLKDGFRVFHDLPFDKFNIDHVLVGPAGVYAVETKTRRKPIDEKGKAAHKVIYDGAFLYYPWGKDTHGLEQAKRQAEYLATWLSSATGEKVEVQPILTLPGWWIDRTGRGEVHVVNTKEIPKIFPRSSASSLSPQQIQRICHQIEQKCRNLEV